MPLEKCVSDGMYLLSEIDSGTQTHMPHNAMPPPSKIFTGCRDYLEKLRNYFDVRADKSQHRKQFLLYGMGGVGKTQICLKFAEESSGW